MIYMENKCLSVKYYECVMLLENNVIEIKMANNTLKVTGARFLKYAILKMQISINLQRICNK